MNHTITKDDLQWLLGEYYKLDKIETYLKECVLLYYPSAKEYVEDEKQFKEEIATICQERSRVSYKQVQVIRDSIIRLLLVL